MKIELKELSQEEMKREVEAWADANPESRGLAETFLQNVQEGAITDSKTTSPPQDEP